MRIFFIVAAVTSFSFGVASALSALRMPILHRWLWVLVCLLGGPGLTINLSSGELLRRVSLIQVLNVGFLRSPEVGAPLILSVAFPLGAVVFQRRRRALLVAPGPASDDPS